MRLITNCYGKQVPRLDTIYIGYDPREQAAVDVLIYTIRTLASRPLNIVTLNATQLRRVGLYRRAPHINSTCWGKPRLDHMIDLFDERPFSTEFSFTRFLVPHLNLYEGYALFMDCDMYFREDPCRVFDYCAEDNKHALWCVKHKYEPAPEESTKMYGCPQTRYSRKNWSSFMVFNCGHPAHQNLTVDDVSTKPGRWLHNLMWLDDDMIGDLDEKWNWLDGHSAETVIPANVHFTTGGPWFSKEVDLGYDTWVPRRTIDKVYVEEWLSLYRSLAVQAVKA